MVVEVLRAIGEHERAELKKAIGEAEKLTSGEIRLFMEDSAEDGPLDRASFLFHKLKMHETNLRNGVLIYVAYVDRKFAIIGDEGIHNKVGDNFWDGIKKRMLAHFKDGKITQGLILGIHESGAALGKYFPRNSNDRNELSDDIILGTDS